MLIHAILLLHEQKGHSFFHLSTANSLEKATEEAYSRLQNQLREALPNLPPSELISVSYDFKPKFKESTDITLPEPESKPSHVPITIIQLPSPEQIQRNTQTFINTINLISNEYAINSEEKSCLASIADRITSKSKQRNPEVNSDTRHVPENCDQVLLQPIKKISRRVARTTRHE